MKTHTITTKKNLSAASVLNLAQRDSKNKIIQLRKVMRIAVVLFILSTGHNAFPDARFHRNSIGLSRLLSTPDARGSGVQSTG